MRARVAMLASSCCAIRLAHQLVRPAGSQLSKRATTNIRMCSVTRAVGLLYQVLWLALGSGLGLALGLGLGLGFCGTPFLCIHTCERWLNNTFSTGAGQKVLAPMS